MRLYILLFLLLTTFLSHAQEPSVSPKTARILQKAYAIAETNNTASLEYLTEQASPGSDAAIDYAIGNLYFRESQYEKALQSYQLAMQQYPLFRRALSDSGRIYLLQGQADKTIELYQKLLRTGQADETIYIILGYALSLNEDYVSAEQAFRQALLLAPNRSEALQGLAQSLIQLQHYNEAYNLFSQLSQQTPTHATLWLTKAKLALFLERPKQAIAQLECAQRLGLNDTNISTLLAELYLDQGMLNQALQAYDALLKEDALSPNNIITAVQRLISLNEWEPAFKLLASLSAKDLTKKEKQKLRPIQARVNTHNKKYADAERAYRDFLAINPLDAHIRIELGDLFFEQEKYEEALIHYEQAEQRSGFESDALQRQAMIEINRNHYPRAIELLEKAQTHTHQPYIEKQLEQLRSM